MVPTVSRRPLQCASLKGAHIVAKNDDSYARYRLYEGTPEAHWAARFHANTVEERAHLRAECLDSSSKPFDPKPSIDREMRQRFLVALDTVDLMTAPDREPTYEARKQATAVLRRFKLHCSGG